MFFKRSSKFTASAESSHSASSDQNFLYNGICTSKPSESTLTHQHHSQAVLYIFPGSAVGLDKCISIYLCPPLEHIQNWGAAFVVRYFFLLLCIFERSCLSDVSFGMCIMIGLAFCFNSVFYTSENFNFGEICCINCVFNEFYLLWFFFPMLDYTISHWFSSDPFWGIFVKGIGL